ncbi:MAG: hypothetical protein K6G38_05165, partial [Gammaproteobacteria bacterium]|nr:hypothetical protein [Gammaproteobacteria bacterium]
TLSLGSSSNMLVYSSNNVTFMDDFKNNKSSIKETIFKNVFDVLSTGVVEHIDTGIRLYDTSADVEVRSMNACDGIIMSELEYYRQLYKDYGLKGLIDYLIG